MKKYLVDDTAYYVNAKGAGPILLFAHGFPFDGRLYEEAIDRLASRFYCVVPDLRGFGQTPLGSNGHNSLGYPRVKMGRFAVWARKSRASAAAKVRRCSFAVFPWAAIYSSNSRGAVRRCFRV